MDNETLTEAIEALEKTTEMIDALVEPPEPNWNVQMLQAGIMGVCLTTKPQIKATLQKLKDIKNVHEK